MEHSAPGGPRETHDHPPSYAYVASSSFSSSSSLPGSPSAASRARPAHHASSHHHQYEHTREEGEYDPQQQQQQYDEEYDHEYDYDEESYAPPEEEGEYNPYEEGQLPDDRLPAADDEEHINPFERPAHHFIDGMDADSESYLDEPLESPPEPISEPVFRRSKMMLSMSYFFAAWGDRMWEFAAIVFIMDLYPDTLVFSSLFGLVEELAAIVTSPSVGRKVDSTDRLLAARWTILGQNISICTASIIFCVALAAVNSDDTTSAWIGLCFCWILFAGGVASIASVGSKLVIHKDWVVVLTAGSPERLTQLNSDMRRIDLVCSILAPLLVGLISIGSNIAAVAFVAAWSAVSLVIELALVDWVYSRIPALHGKQAPPTPTVTSAEALSDPSRPLNWVALKSLAFMDTARVFVRHFIGTMREFRSHPIFLASLAYSMLYISVLSLGGIMTSWLKVQGVSIAVLGAMRAVAALVGVGATLCVPAMVKRWGLVQAGLIAIWLQIAMLFPVVIAFLFSSNTGQLVALLLFLCLSRFGLWSFDLCETQLMQSRIQQEHAGVINGAQESLVSLFSLGGFLLTIIFESPSLFAAPAWISFVACTAAALAYTRFAAKDLGRTNPFPSIDSFRIDQPLEYQPQPDESPAAPEHEDEEANYSAELSQVEVDAEYAEEEGESQYAY